jgi:hypothetical protein
MCFKRRQRLNACVESPFSILCVASTGPERLDVLSLALDDLAGVGDGSPGRKELIVRAVSSIHDYVFADRPRNVLDLNQYSRPCMTL